MKWDAKTFQKPEEDVVNKTQIHQLNVTIQQFAADVLSPIRMISSVQRAATGYDKPRRYSRRLTYILRRGPWFTLQASGSLGMCQDSKSFSGTYFCSRARVATFTKSKAWMIIQQQSTGSAFDLAACVAYSMPHLCSFRQVQCLQPVSLL